jgi:hypothetical protein
LNGEQHGHGVSQEFVLGFNIRGTDIFHQPSIYVGTDFVFKVLAKEGLDSPRNLEGNSGALRNLDGNVCSLDRSDSSDEAEIWRSIP